MSKYIDINSAAGFLSQEVPGKDWHIHLSGYLMKPDLSDYLRIFHNAEHLGFNTEDLLKLVYLESNGSIPIDTAREHLDLFLEKALIESKKAELEMLKLDKKTSASKEMAFMPDIASWSEFYLGFCLNQLTDDDLEWFDEHMESSANHHYKASYTLFGLAFALESFAKNASSATQLEVKSISNIAKEQASKSLTTAFEIAQLSNALDERIADRKEAEGAYAEAIKP